MAHIVLLLCTMFPIVILNHRTSGQITNFLYSHALHKKSYYIMHDQVSSINREKIIRGIDMFTGTTCFDFTYTGWRRHPDIKFMVNDNDPRMCKVNSREGSLAVFNIGGCAGPGEIAALFFSLSGLQVHERRPDRDLRVDFPGVSRRPANPYTPPKYNTYGQYDFNSIMHSKADATEYAMVPKRHPEADPRRFPSKEQFQILARRCMGQRIRPSQTDLIQLNSELCGAACRIGSKDCGVGGYPNGKFDCSTCVCAGNIKPISCSPHAILHETTNIVLGPGAKKDIILRVNQRYQPLYSIHTRHFACPCSGYTPAVHFVFRGNPHLLMQDGTCQDYISITTLDGSVLPEEVRMCGPISRPINDFYIATTKDIRLTLIIDEWVEKRASQNITLTVEGACYNLDRGRALYDVAWSYIACTKAMSTTTMSTMHDETVRSPQSLAPLNSLTLAWPLIVLLGLALLYLLCQ